MILLSLLPQSRTWRSAPTMLWIGGVTIMITTLLGVGLIPFLPINAGLLLRIAAWSSLPIAGTAAWIFAQIAFGKAVVQ